MHIARHTHQINQLIYLFQLFQASCIHHSDSECKHWQSKILTELRFFDFIICNLIVDDLQVHRQNQLFVTFAEQILDLLAIFQIKAN